MFVWNWISNRFAGTPTPAATLPNNSELLDDNDNEQQGFDIKDYSAERSIMIAGGHFAGVSTLFKHLLMKKYKVSHLLEKEKSTIYENVCRAVVRYCYETRTKNILRETTSIEMVWVLFFSSTAKRIRQERNGVR